MDESHFSFPPGMPEEAKQKYLETVNREEAEAWSRSHAVSSLFNELNEDQLNALRDMIYSCLHGGKQRVCFLLGQAYYALDQRFGICSACGKKHDDELLEVTSDRPSATD